MAKRATAAQKRTAIRLLRTGKSTRYISAQVGMSRQWVLLLAREQRIEMKPNHMPPSKRQEVERRLKQGMTIRQVVDACGIGKSTAARHRLRTINEDGVMFRDLQGSRRCPVHGLVRVWPCVACLAEGSTTCG